VAQFSTGLDTGRVFARWFHAYNPRIARSGLNPDAKSIGFQLYEQDEAADDFADRLRGGLEGFLKFRSARLALPLAVAITPTRPGTWPDARRAALAMRRVLSPVSDLAAVAVRDPAPDEPSITIEPERVIIALADVASVTLDRHRASDDLSDDEHGADLILALAVALTYVGQANLAAQLAAAVAHLSSVIVDMEVTMTIAAAMFQSQRISEAIKLADNLDESEDPDVQAAAFMLLTVLLGKRGRLNPVERDAALESAERRIERRRVRADDEGMAAEAYNLAMLHKRVQQGGEAVRWFREAAEKDPTYLARDYYHGDMAGALFESRDYEGAAEHYERALELGGRGLDRALLADSLLYSGRYEEARVKLDAYVADTPGRDAAEWRLKARAVRLLIDAVGSEQKRDERMATALLDAWNFEEGPDMSIEEAKDSCRKAIALDACCGQAWFRLGLLAIGPDAEDPTAGSAESIAGAVLARHDLSHWHNAVLCIEPSDTETVLDVFYSGYNLNKENFVNAIVAAIDAAPHLAEHRERLIALLDETVAAYESEQAGDVIMRFRGEDGQMTEIVLSTADDAYAGESDQKEVKWLPRTTTSAFMAPLAET
jgi:tetratricopeptide (TPR) repeat protein